MKNKIKIGIPRTSIYNRSSSLLKEFILNLGCKIILSDNTKKIKLGKINLPNNTCNFLSSYYDHIIELTNSCDYVIVSKHCEYNQSCHKNINFLKSLECHLSPDQILMINPYKTELIEYFKIGIKITKNPLRIIISYYLAKQKQKRNNINKINRQINRLNNNQNKILLVANYNNLENNKKLNNIINYLKTYNITVLQSNYTKEKEVILHSTYFENNKISRETKKLVGSIYYYRYCIKGIIFLKMPSCTIDKYIINTIRNDIKEIPILDIDITEEYKNIETIIHILVNKIN